MSASPDRPAPRPDWLADELIERTKAVWSPRYGRMLTTAEAIEILQNFGRLIDVFQEKTA